jgi:transcription elongation GreA/GreB family factor
VGAALMGHKKGDKVTVQAPAGPVSYTVVRVS